MTKLNWMKNTAFSCSLSVFRIADTTIYFKVVSVVLFFVYWIFLWKHLAAFPVGLCYNVALNLLFWDYFLLGVSSVYFYSHLRDIYFLPFLYFFWLFLLVFYSVHYHPGFHFEICLFLVFEGTTILLLLLYVFSVFLSFFVFQVSRALVNIRVCLCV